MVSQIGKLHLPKMKVTAGENKLSQVPRANILVLLLSENKETLGKLRFCEVQGGGKTPDNHYIHVGRTQQVWEES